MVYMVKLYDIAKELNISPSTVSKALNNKGRISPALRKRILEVADQHNYHPNEYARGLKTNQSTMIGVILPDISNIFFGKLLKSIDSTAREHGYTVLYCDANEDLANEKSHFDVLSSKNVCGIIIAPSGISDIYSNVSAQQNLVFIDTMPAENMQHPVITIENYQASYELTEHLICRGFKKILMLSGTQTDTTTIERIRGYEQCMHLHGLSAGARVCAVRHSFEDGKRFVNELLKTDQPEAIITENNFLAYGALSALRSHGLRVPEDIAVACFDGIDDFDTMFVNLTTVIQPIEKIGRRAVELIIARGTNAADACTGGKEVVDYTLRVGDST